jgi:hypothetical protein
MFNVEVKRYEFFRDKNKNNVRFASCSPYKKCAELQVCNCTKQVSKRPKSMPEQVSTYCVMSKNFEDRKMEINFSGSFGGFCRKEIIYYVQWNDPEILKAHASFIWGKDSIYFEISKKDFGISADIFIGFMFFGNTVDISTLLNGHSPSKIINLSNIKPKDIWFHCCSWGSEAISFIPAGKEKENWWKFYNNSQNIFNRSELYLTPEFSVDEVRSNFEKDTFIQNIIQKNYDFIESILNNLSNTKLYEGGLEVYKKAHEDEGSFVVDSITGKTVAVH